ncbi:MAG: 3-phosphoshikimate 1-carboxyvinyltransferase [Thermodesulfovibrionales bacterium]|nr:3-phosphoshikimate 1-carboxyvinyltransferase [Thermodesulfovibrionales bacterium]
MKDLKVEKIKSLKGEIAVPADKSISHRSVIFASIANGKSIIRNFLMAEDPLSTIQAMRALGIKIEERKSNTSKESYELTIYGNGLRGLKEPFEVINCGNSGTTIRLISGLLAGNPFFSVLTGDHSLKQRPMARVINPLKEMGAHILARMNDRFPPIAIKGGALKAIKYAIPIASAQVKSCLMLAALYAQGVSEITEPFKSRDHSERLLITMGADIKVNDLTIQIKGLDDKLSSLNPIEVTVPSDFSSAAFFIIGGIIVPNSELILKDVGINPTRTGLLTVLNDIGANVTLENIKLISGEPVADIICKSTDNLKAFEINKNLMPSLIDEFPILCVLASQAEGISHIRGAEELRVKESDRIKAMVTELRKMGVEIEEYPDGVSIKGKVPLKGAELESYKDHRIAMSLTIAGLIAEGTTYIKDFNCVDISFPNFYNLIKCLIH